MRRMLQQTLWPKRASARRREAIAVAPHFRGAILEKGKPPRYGTRMHTIYFVIGASGSGKTSAVHELEKTRSPGLKMFFFDRIGVPSEQEKIEKWDSGGGWQRAMTIEWVKRMRPELSN